MECAQQGKGHTREYAKFFDTLAEDCKTYRVSFLAGNFNMALFVVPQEMWARSLECRWCGSYAWRKRECGPYAWPPAVAGEVHFDSMVLFRDRPRAHSGAMAHPASALWRAPTETSGHLPHRTGVPTQKLLRQH